MDAPSSPTRNGGVDAPDAPACGPAHTCQPDALRNALERERAARKEAERLLEDKSRELFVKGEELRELNAGLESKVAQRTAELARALAAARAGVRAKDEFLTNMSHEVRTPLTSMLGYAEMLLEPDLTPSQTAEYVGVIRRHGEQLLDAIDDILELSRLAAGDARPEVSPLDPTELIASAVRGWIPAAHAKGLSLVFEARTELPRSLWADAGRIRSILSKLLSNAVRFTLSGGICVSADLVAGSPSRLRISVTDTGPGIEPARQATIFQPFVQSDNSLTRQHGGMGLGLTVALRTAEFLGGSISLESEPGKGSSFRIEIPVGCGGPIALVEAAAPPDLCGLRILMTAATENCRDRLQTLLEAAGAEVVFAAGGEQAVEAALTAREQGGGFSLIVLDMQMPGLSGDQTTILLRRNGYGGPVIVVTPCTPGDEPARCVAAGCSEHLPKPIDDDRLLRLCERLTGRAAGPNAPVCQAA